MPRALFALPFLAAALLALPPADAAAASPHRSYSEQRESLLMLLSARDLQLGRNVLDSIGPDVHRLLIEIADYPRGRLDIRARALAGLAFYPTPRTLAYLRTMINERTLRGTRDGNHLRRQALRSLGLGFGEVAIADLLAHQRDTDPMVRTAVAQALGDTESVYAAQHLEQWLDLERDMQVRVAIDRALNRLRGL